MAYQMIHERLNKFKDVATAIDLVAYGSELLSNSKLIVTANFVKIDQNR